MFPSVIYHDYYPIHDYIHANICKYQLDEVAGDFETMNEVCSMHYQTFTITYLLLTLQAYVTF